MLRQLVSLATHRLLLRAARESLPQMKKVSLISALLLVASPAAAQVATSMGQQSGGQGGPSARTQAPTTGVFCIEEMTATFCNVPTGPNTNGYGSSGVSRSSSGAVSSGVSMSFIVDRVGETALVHYLRPQANTRRSCSGIQS
jgi:hypothetical protein